MNRHKPVASRSRANGRIQIVRRKSATKIKEGNRSRPRARRLHVQINCLCLSTRGASLRSFVHAERWWSNHRWWLAKSSLAARMVLPDRVKALLARATLTSTWSTKLDTSSLPLAAGATHSSGNQNQRAAFPEQHQKRGIKALIVVSAPVRESKHPALKKD